MDFMQLEMFVAMVEERNFHKAAERVFRTQPALSMALRKLEQEIGSQLFDRSDRSNYTLTDSGEVLYDYARRLLSLRNETLHTLQNLHTLQAGRLRIGANESTSLYLLPQIILAFREQYPRIKIEVFRQFSAKLPFDVRQRNLDVAILSFLPEETDLETTLIMRDKLVLIASPEHPLASQSSVHIRDLGGESFIAHNAQSPARQKVIDTFRRFQTPLNITTEIATIETIKKFVAKNIGLGFAPLMCVKNELERGELVTIPLEGFHHERQLWLVRRRTDAHSHAAKAFMKVMQALAEESAQEDGLPATEPLPGEQTAVN